MQSDNIGIGIDEIEQGESSNVFYKKERFRVKETNTFGSLKHRIKLPRAGMLLATDFVNIRFSKV
ncbi:hypothetical protein [Flavobacterium urumqiense]|uniref:hypothetical protein n=1 Tax=Flavobacterium urumqiense TaxID=935224 RepID=UPI001FC9C20A|nr:hypothetical protein [Flavobacterium urumqiense]